MSIDNGGPAYPQGYNRGNNGIGHPVIEHTGGMTKRELFARGILPTIILLNRESMGIAPAGEVAVAIKYADELIKQLKETESG